MLDAMFRDIKSEMNSLVAPIQWEDSSGEEKGQDLNKSVFTAGNLSAIHYRNTEIRNAE